MDQTETIGQGGATVNPRTQDCSESGCEAGLGEESEYDNTSHLFYLCNFFSFLSLRKAPITHDLIVVSLGISVCAGDLCVDISGLLAHIISYAVTSFPLLFNMWS